MKLDHERILHIISNVSNNEKPLFKAYYEICEIIGISSETGRYLNKKTNSVKGSVEYWREKCDILTEIWNTAPQEKVSEEHEKARLKYSEFMTKHLNKHER